MYDTNMFLNVGYSHKDFLNNWSANKCMKKDFFSLFILVVLGLCCSARAFSSSSECAALHCSVQAAHCGGLSGRAAPALGM